MFSATIVSTCAKYLSVFLALSTATGTTAERAQLSRGRHQACRGKVTNNHWCVSEHTTHTACPEWRSRGAPDTIMKLYYEIAIIITAWAGQTCYVSFSRKWADCTLRWWRQSVRCQMLRLPRRHPGESDLYILPDILSENESIIIPAQSSQPELLCHVRKLFSAT